MNLIKEMAILKINTRNNALYTGTRIGIRMRCNVLKVEKNGSVSKKLSCKRLAVRMLLKYGNSQTTATKIENTSRSLSILV